ncbi:exosortase-associated protein EpsI, B-type [Methylobacillus flagellatus]|uniref:Methanolan biosynthesis EpsI domain-containing protein n=1 Tax=Methylobacillus flagellatus (strain ATCC 51484 / DSM 6875 / VKM B-1610 / KT) TaxID=265072 RepID=Q1GZP8_METFK|nr:exosortase-associated protein EpsI, B-type [Methylobacillus flagellatus]ABE50289.1 conserved hypothetical protein [Methylobacillus flagellatus KT]
MDGFTLRNLIIFLLLLVATLGGVILKPTKFVNAAEDINLEAMIPKEFDEWKIDPTITPIQVSPEVQQNLNKVYDQTLSRTYINKQGMRIMLSIAYGGDQSRGLQAHKPETCYTAQGFNVDLLGNAILNFDGYEIKVRHLLAQHGARYEPILYWMRVGETTVYGGLGQTIKRFELGLQGYIPDGLLFRVSSISRDNISAFTLQEEFVKSLLKNVDSKSRKKLIGTFS